MERSRERERERERSPSSRKQRIRPSHLPVHHPLPPLMVFYDIQQHRGMIPLHANEQFDQYTTTATTLHNYSILYANTPPLYANKFCWTNPLSNKQLLWSTITACL